MAKKDKDALDNELLDYDSEEESGKGGKILSVLIGVIIFVLLLGTLAACIKLNVGGFGTLLRPALKDVPVISSILPDVSDSEIAFEENYDFDNLSDAIKHIKELEAQIDTLTNDKSSNEKTIEELQAEVTRLKEFEDNVEEFNKRVLEFDQNVVFGDEAPDVEEYKAYYEQINEENAAEIYRQVIEQLAYDEKTQQQADRYAKMEPETAAAALETMTGDLDLVADILGAMKVTNSAAIMNEFSSDFCAKITKKMSMVEAR